MTAKRALWALGLFLLCGGPTPGAVGDCTGDTGDEPADLAAYCQEKNELICVRRALRDDISQSESDDCRREVISACMRSSWAGDCRPTMRQTDACLNALYDRETLETPEDEIVECQRASLCNVSTRGAVPDGGL
jgi:hypothetical protein